VGATFEHSKFRKNPTEPDATHRDWVNYTCPSGFPCPRAGLFSVEVIDGRMRSGDLKLSLGGTLIHGEKMGNRIIPRKQTIFATWFAADITTESERPKGLNINFKSYRPSYDRGRCR
jgi:hypothetical protein